MNDADKPEKRKVTALIVAGGRGSRAATHDDESPKQYRQIGGETVMTRTLRVFHEHVEIDDVVVAIHADDGDAFAQAALPFPGVKSVPGGTTRQESVLRGLEYMESTADPDDLVLIHDAVRPFVDNATIDRVIDALSDANGVIAAMPVVDTLKSASDELAITGTVPRAGLWRAQTPQGFVFKSIFGAHKQAAAENRFDFTDDAAVAEWSGVEVKLVEGGADNVKLTTAEDLQAADRRLMTERHLALADIRTGNGYDVHAFTDGDSVILGGVKIAHDRALKGHSDADVAMHAVTDALFGALADGDIGSHFPPSDPVWKGAPSRVFLEKAVAGVTERCGMISHIDLTIICEAPRIGPYRDAIRDSLATLCDIEVGRISVKATTTEKLGFTGRREGIAAMATATIRLPM